MQEITEIASIDLIEGYVTLHNGQIAKFLSVTRRLLLVSH